MIVNVAVIGSRGITDKEWVFSKLDEYLNRFKTPSIKLQFANNYPRIITGGAKGVDSLAEEYAKLNGLSLRVIKPINPSDKFSYLLRNVEIITLADVILAFWDGESSGTGFVIGYAEKRNKDITVIRSDKR